MRLIDAAAQALGRDVRPLAGLDGGMHAEVVALSDGEAEFVARRFPVGDRAAEREVVVLDHLAELGDLVPRLVAVSDDEQPVIVTDRLAGGPPAPTLRGEVMAGEMGRCLARIHRICGVGLPAPSRRVPQAQTPVGFAARATPPPVQRTTLVHGDFWCGNALWIDERISGVVDWSGAHRGAPGEDLAWCRQDLVLLGAPEAATVFLEAYRDASVAAGVDVTPELAQIRAWDLDAAARAEPVVGTWAPNYAGIGRGDLTPDVLHGRLSAWIERLLRD